ncbi:MULTISPECIES: hypothetical protein [unclassified Acinetobacter]|uniref:hypothetical protein n=1 Tax=unclassified Acinetobacter TaxID=196816 RepID=UPI0015D37607|nr:MULTISPECIES: hypothetical protein [unclassified Acinetobacter]
MTFKTASPSRDRARSAFEKRLDILILAAHAGCEITVTDVLEAALETSRMTARACLNDLVECGYLVKTTIYAYQATEQCKQLFGVKG